MVSLIGYIMMTICIVVGFTGAGGSMASLWQPLELLTIGGGAIGAFIAGNNAKTIKTTIRAVKSFASGGSFKKAFYVELLSMYFELTTKIRKDGVLAIEGDIDDYTKSPLFTKYKLVVKEKTLMNFLCDHLRLITTGRVDLLQLETLLDEDLESIHHEVEIPINTVTKIADSLPAWGIVAAVMGIVITMGAINAPPAVLGHHVASALVGTFMGILMGYGIVGPVSSALEAKMKAQMTILHSAKVVLVASTSNLAPTIAVEFSRKLLYSEERPTNKELEEIMRSVKSGGAAS